MPATRHSIIEKPISKGTYSSRTAVAFLFRPVDAASLGFFRIAFGLCMACEVARYFTHGWINRYYIRPTFHFTYLFFDWVRPWPGNGMYVHFAVLGALAILVALGYLYRFSIVCFFLGITYVFLIEQSRYLNHFYLICLVSFLLIFVSADSAFSLRSRAGRSVPGSVPFWNVAILRFQMFVVYFYGGIAKLNGDWLRGEPIRMWLHERAHLPLIGSYFDKEYVVYTIVYGGLAFDLSIGILLLWRRTRAVGLVLACLFHGFNAFVFDIGVFPYLAIALTLMFLEPDWPQRWLGPLKRDLLLATAHRVEFAPSRRVALLLAAYVTIQLLIPLRHCLYPGDVNWTEEGHRFSWRMKLRDKKTKLAMSIVDPKTGVSEPIDSLDYLKSWQAEAMANRPDMILQFAHYLRDSYWTENARRPRIYAKAWCSLNGAPEHLLIDPRVDLSEQPRTWRPADWILPDSESIAFAR